MDLLKGDDVEDMVWFLAELDILAVWTFAVFHLVADQPFDEAFRLYSAATKSFCLEPLFVLGAVVTIGYVHEVFWHSAKRRNANSRCAPR